MPNASVQLYHTRPRMNPLAKIFKPNQKNLYSIQTNQLTKAEETIFQEVLREWTDIPTLDLLLEQWSKHRTKTLSLLNVQQNCSFILLNVSSLNRYIIEAFNLINSVPAPIVILNGTHHDENAIKLYATHFFNYNIFTSLGSNAFGGVQIAMHKSIRSQRVNKFDKHLNSIVLELGSDSEIFQLVTCYSSSCKILTKQNSEFCCEQVNFVLVYYMLQNSVQRTNRILLRTILWLCSALSDLFFWTKIKL
jgi:hypothetical protein